MALIDLSNYDSLLVQSTQGRSGTPDGNIFFDVENGRIELITVEESATIDMTSRGGGASESNPLMENDGIKLEALYAFEREQRRIDENLRKYDYFFKGTFKFGGAYEVVNGRSIDDMNGSNTSLAGDDRAKIRGSGWIERDTAGDIGRIYYGVVSLGNIENSSQPYYQLADGGIPSNFKKDGPINEAIQVYGDATKDVNTVTFDTRTFLSNKVRTFGNNFDEKKLGDSGVSEMGGYSSGFALAESGHLTTGNYAIGDVYDTPVSPWDGMSLEKLSSSELKSGFNEADGSFTWILNNTSNGTLDQCVAYLDALAQTDDDIDSGAETVTNGKRVGTWYTYDAQGRIVTRSGADSLGLFIENIPVSDEQKIVFTDDSSATKTRPFVVSVEVTVGATAVADDNAWFHGFFLSGPGGSDFNTNSALTVVDQSSTPVKGNVKATEIGNKIVFAFDYDGDIIGGDSGTDKDVVFECEGDGGATASKTVFTISRNTIVTTTCAPGLETNS